MPTMQAVVYKRATKSLEYQTNFPKPRLERGQVLLKVLACGFCGSDHSMIESGLAPDDYIFGHEFVAIIEEYGPKSRMDIQSAKLPIGTRVMTRPSFCGVCPSCQKQKYNLCTGQRRSTGIGDLHGGFAEYLVAYPNMLIPVPENLSVENAAMSEMFASAYHGVVQIPPTHNKALVCGAGPIGLACVQLLKVKGYKTIVVSEPIAAKRELALSFGATATLDPLKTKLNDFISTIDGGIDVVYECAGIPTNINEAINILNPTGIICLLGLNMHKAIAEMNTFKLNLKEISIFTSMSNTHLDNITCLQLLSSGLIDAQAIISDKIQLKDLVQVYKEKIHTAQAIKVLILND